MSSNEKNITGLILAAGLSGRMKEFKPLLKINSETFISVIIKKLSHVCNEIIVVTGFNSDLIFNEIDKSGLSELCKIVFNADYGKGMFSSLQKGIEVIQSEWLIYHFVDQPSLPIDFYLEFAGQISSAHDWIQPVNKGRKGHPIIFNKKVCELIKQKKFDSSLREISHDSSVIKYYWDYKSDLILEDIDTSDDYKTISK